MNKKLLENTGRHMDRIVMNTSCKKHGADEGMPCYAIFPDTNSVAMLSGACGARIKRAGFNGKITPTSFQTSRAHKDVKPKSSHNPSFKKKDAA